MRPQVEKLHDTEKITNNLQIWPKYLFLIQVKEILALGKSWSHISFFFSFVKTVKQSGEASFVLTTNYIIRLICMAVVVGT